jgi:hypothetical protein
MIKKLYAIIFIVLLVMTIFSFKFLYRLFKFMNFYHLLPHKKIINTEINVIMIGLPTIDRDADMVEEVYKAINKSIRYAKKYYPNIEFIFFPIMRETDKKCIDFWEKKNNIKKDVYLMKSYEIDGRHNMDKIVETFSKILEKAREKDVDGLFIVESDIVINKDTIKSLIDNQKEAHVTLCPHDIPWRNYPIIGNYSCIYSVGNSDEIYEDKFLIYGQGTGCILIGKDVLRDNNIKFYFETHLTIENIDAFGHDIGFYKLLNKHRYKVLLVNKKVNHKYRRHIIEFKVPKVDLY